MSSNPRRALATVALVGALATASCSEAPAGGAGSGDADLHVLAAVYPLQFVAERVGGDDVAVDALTPAGAEPHDLELSPALVRVVGDADVVIYLRGFQPSVDAAIDAREPARAVDVAAAARLDGRGDPHFWLDPTRLADVAQQVADAFAAADPANAGTYAEAATALTADLIALDEEFTAALATCESRVVVTTHDSFSYLADRYDLEQVPISGLDPEAEPSPARLREVALSVREADVTTIFTETLVSPRAAKTLATDLGLTTDVLDPIEGRSGEDDYLGVMRANLAALKTALRCG